MGVGVDMDDGLFYSLNISTLIRHTDHVLIYCEKEIRVELKLIGFKIYLVKLGTSLHHF